MTVALIVFVIAFLVVFGIFYAAVLRPEVDEREAIERRLTGAAGRAKAAKRVSFLRSADDVAAFPVLDRLLAPWQAITAPISRSIEHADLKITVGALLLLALMAGVVAYAVMSVLFAATWLALGAAALAFWLPFPIVRFKAQRRIRVFEEQFPEAIDLMSRALRAGHAFTTALSMVAEEGQQPVAGDFRKLYDAQNFGMPLPDALRAFAGRIPLLDARFFVTAVLTQRESGGNLSEVLDNLARVIRERFKVKRQIQVISAHGRMTAGVLIGIPPVLALAMFVINPENMAVLTTDPLGWGLISGAIFLQVVGSLIIKKLINIEY
jgi:tight adherence protein B